MEKTENDTKYTIKEINQFRHEVFKIDETESLVKKTSIVCPYCFKPSVEFLGERNKWFCKACKSDVNFMSRFVNGNILFYNYEKIRIYEMWGIQALTKLTGKNTASLQYFVHNYLNNTYTNIEKLSWEEKERKEHIKILKENVGKEIQEQERLEAERYAVYKEGGINALVQLTGQSKESAERFVARYFEKSCLSKGDKCLYHGLFQESKKEKEQIRNIKLLFASRKRILKNFYQLVNYNSKLFEEKSAFLSKEKEIKDEYIFFKETAEQILSQFDDCIIALATEDLHDNQQISIKNSDEQLVAGLNFNIGIEGFAWNDAKKGEMVGVLPISYNFCQELIDLYANLLVKVGNIPVKPILTPSDKKGLTQLERVALEIIIAEDDIYQNQLWKKLEVDSRKCSRIVISLVDKKLVSREQAVSNGARTYLLKSRVII
ncbi:hypothetical protein [Methanolobus bombayensis]|uniref:hypothetical protein n=1 Tax=Methanolobus bombayensis TaxID=38023 RepID=UPI001AE489B0|nr:hypothetical protein [Methanolobus bombayensis]MBP1908264.1 hypothetical protein [Methanolobus bombayensis]